MKMQYKGEYLTVPVFCLNCEVAIPHKIIKQTKQKEHDVLHPETNEYLFTEEIYKEVIQCYECANWSIRKYIKNKLSDSIEDDAIYIFPLRREKKIEQGFKKYLPEKSTIFKNYAESITALHQGLFFSSGASVRLTLESICRTLNIKTKKHLSDLRKEAHRRGCNIVTIPSKWKASNLRNNTGLKQQIDYLVDQYLVPRGFSRSEYQILHEVREWGNSIIHDGIVPTEQELMLAFTIIENLIDSAFVQPQKRNEHKLIAKQFKQERRKRK